jgi:hypothetical protein
MPKRLVMPPGSGPYWNEAKQFLEKHGADKVLVVLVEEKAWGSFYHHLRRGWLITAGAVAAICLRGTVHEE